MHNAGLDPLDAADADLDYDQDTLTNAQEAQLGTNPFEEDSDADGFNDLDEVGDDPNNPLDVDNNGIIDALESYWLGVTALDQQMVIADGELTNADYRLSGRMTVASTASSSAAYTLSAEMTP